MQTTHAADIQNLYLVFSSTPTKMGKFIRIVTRNTYNHVSISLDPQLQTMYSFARRYKNTPFIGGFTEESLLRYRASGNTMIKVCRIPMPKLYSAAVLQDIQEFNSHPRRYIYNIFSAALAPFHRRVHIEDAYTCVEFAIRILGSSPLRSRLKPNRFYTIKELEQTTSDCVVYDGAASSYPCPEGWGNDMFPERRSQAFHISGAAKIIFTLLLRICKSRYKAARNKKGFSSFPFQ